VDQRLGPHLHGTTDIDVDVVREGKNLKGRVLTLVVTTVGKSGLAKALHNTVKAIESRNHADAPDSQQHAREPAAA
jgi:hypothetical protein